MRKKTGLAVLLSGGGRTLQNIMEHIKSGRLDARVNAVIASRPDAYGLVRAGKEGIKAFCVDYREYGRNDDSRGFAGKLYEHITGSGADLVVLAGFMHLFPVRRSWEGRVMNVHPALIPAFCGKGYYGMRVHRAVVESGVKVSGCTVHFADGKYDHGPIILQSAVPVRAEDTPEMLAERVFEAECGAYPEAIKLFAEGRLEIRGRKVFILDRREGTG